MNKFVFICGLHRSGTSLLYNILRNQNEISGMENTNVPEDEGQHLQNIFLPANAFGGPGKFGFNKESYLDDKSALINDENKEKLFQDWAEYWDLEKDYLIEKSPPNLVRTLFLQAMFPNSYFITIFRHPVATSLATKKWSKTTHHSLVKHWLVCHNQYLNDKIKLKKSLDLKYEDLIYDSTNTLIEISKFLGIYIKKNNLEIRKGVNNKYFSIWRKHKKNFFYKKNIRKTENEFESDIKKFGYSFDEVKDE
ncbi:uncharacterized protein METZ01_LOCUS331198 [marine metagenome]|uniref:Sulfotransferase domain-containing protein n=1 Tax=marine metagenome TaxID=408172 RepID=A0A382PYD1_9ZZZZ